MQTTRRWYGKKERDRAKQKAKKNRTVQTMEAAMVTVCG